MNDAPLALAVWLDRRLASTLDFHMPSVRLYGIVVNDPAGLDHDEQAARPSFLGEHRDGHVLVGGSLGVLARSFDAAAIVTTGWAAPISGNGSMTHRPSRHPDRRRVRAVAVVSDDGLGAVMRYEDDPDSQVELPGHVDGAMAAAMIGMWFARCTDLVNLRTTRGGCIRRA